MAPNMGENRRIGTQRNRLQAQNSAIGSKSMEFNINTGRIMTNTEGFQFKWFKEIRKN